MLVIERKVVFAAEDPRAQGKAYSATISNPWWDVLTMYRMGDEYIYALETQDGDYLYSREVTGEEAVMYVLELACPVRLEASTSQD